MIGEIKRKSIHFLVLAIPIGYYFLPKVIVLPIIALITAGFLMFDIFRLLHINFWTWLQKYMGDIFREHEHFKLAGSSYIMVGATISVVVFNKYIAILVLSFTVLGDIAAALIGKRFGKHKIWNQKTIEGSLAFFIVSFIISLVVPGIPLYIKIIACLIATLVESLPSFIDDNLTIPLIAGGIAQLIWLGF